MSRLVAVPSSAGGDILIEVTEPEARQAVMRSGAPTNVIQKATASIEDGMTRLLPAATGILRHLSESTDGIEEVQIKFGVKFSAEAGVFIASAASEATFEIEMKWSRPHKPA